ncbi:Ku protein [Streptomyces sp. SL13]|uniref:Non-homologous end joining protein Ku n=1 Tax=Streptantibioticus silvisoli TaxID=2705255 RepID=A0AA90HAL5_9ACTN|nr:Ku protein [Streptantibioticus silvisoli]MDI5974335.1 Ku protein [Streptantibioticus silvisoli]
MRSIWKGAITFGLVSIPVSLFKATQEHRLPLHQVHAEDGGRVRQKRVCEVCGEEVAYADLAKGYEDGQGRQAVLTDDDLADLPLPSKKIIDVLAFVDADDIDPVMLSSTYYLDTGSPTADKPYALLRDAMVEGGKAAITKITLSTRESLALLRVHEGVLTLHTMYWPDEVRPATDLGPAQNVTIRPQERKMAASLMATLSEDFDLDALHDEYQSALERLVSARLEGKPAPAPEAAGAPDNVIDLTSALQASLDASSGRASGGGAGDQDGSAAGPAGGGRAAKKTAAGKKTAAKKTAAKTSSGGSAGKGAAAKKTAAAGKKKAAAKKTSARKAS